MSCVYMLFACTTCMFVCAYEYIQLMLLRNKATCTVWPKTRVHRM